ncbi:hypothetical protein [Streptomyces sp. CA-111067]|uniref:hypothetical protein n=1 Tax=Streptomyces sp. CA-111067 TaxID=3240046 RepID=UPI003D985906
MSALDGRPARSRWWSGGARALWGPVRDFGRAELGAPVGEVWRRLRTGGVLAVPLTLTACVGIVALQVLQHLRGASDWVDRLGGVYATLPWWQALLRTPLSLFVPDPSLPIWGLMLQVVVVFGIAETTLGARRTLGVALLATLAGTAFARYSLWTGPGGFLGLPTSDLLVRDTGPSAAVVALGLYVACRYRAWWTAAAIVAAMVIEVVTITNLAGFEHLAGAAAILLLTAFETWTGLAPPTPARPGADTLTR